VRTAVVSLAIAVLSWPAVGVAQAPKRMQSTCAADDPIPTPPGYTGWERSSVVAWEAVELQGGIVPDIEEDRSHAPPAWWRYPSPLRSAELLAEEAKKPKGLYTAVAPGDLQTGDLLVRTRGAGVCGKMAVIAGQADDTWITIEGGANVKIPTKEDPEVKHTADKMFFDGKRLRPEVTAYRLAVKKDSTMGHVRELERDLTHLERTIAERPPLIPAKGRGAVEEKLHDLVDEAVSLAADPAFDEQRRVLTGRALALAAALDWPGAAEQAKVVLDDALARTPLRADAILARANLHLIAGENDRAADLADSAVAMPEAPPRLRYVLGRALLARGKQGPGLEAIRKYLESDPADPRAKALVASAGKQPAPAGAAPPAAGGELVFSATPDRARAHSKSWGFDVEWPLSWRVVAQSAVPDASLIVELTTGRALRDDGETERAGVSLLVQKPGGGAAATLAKQGARNMFPDAKLKTLPPLFPGSKREQFRERKQGSQRLGEVTTFERAGSVYFLVLNASTGSYPKLKDEYAAFVKSVAPAAKK
jgi:hypothetical protein